MTVLYRRNYRDAELDDTTGPVPTYGNPGSVGGDGEALDGHHVCRPCDVKWRGPGPCWNYGGVS